MRDERLENAREAYSRDIGNLRGCVGAMETEIRRLLEAERVSGSVTGRVKTIDSILKKLVLKTNHTYNTLPDRVGLRVIANDRGAACDVIRKHFHVLKEDDKSGGRPANELGYGGVHFDIEPSLDFYPETGLVVEVQVRTYAEHAWCEVSHKIDYKNDGQNRIPQRLRRKLMLAAGLLEMADLTLREVVAEVTALPEFEFDATLRWLHERYADFTARPPHAEMSAVLLHVLLPLYTDANALRTAVTGRIEAKQDVLLSVFRRNERTDAPRASLLFQPEVLVVYDLLQWNPVALVEAWVEHLPFDELERIAVEFGDTLTAFEHRRTGSQ